MNLIMSNIDRAVEHLDASFPLSMERPARYERPPWPGPDGWNGAAAR